MRGVVGPARAPARAVTSTMAPPLRHRSQPQPPRTPNPGVHRLYRVTAPRFGTVRIAFGKAGAGRMTAAIAICPPERCVTVHYKAALEPDPVDRQHHLPRPGPITPGGAAARRRALLSAGPCLRGHACVRAGPMLVFVGAGIAHQPTRPDGRTTSRPFGSFLVSSSTSAGIASASATVRPIAQYSLPRSAASISSAMASGD